MPFNRNLNFKPSKEFYNRWAAAPKDLSIGIDNLEAPVLFQDLSSKIWLYYLFFFCAITLDLYVGFSILSKSGVSVFFLLVFIVGDLIAAILPGILNSNFSNSKMKNVLMEKLLKTKIREWAESDTEFNEKRSRLRTTEIKPTKNRLKAIKLIHITMIAIIIGIALWKIYSFYKVVPPSMSIFAMARGKMIIVASILCAVFHILGSEKAASHFLFFIRKREIKDYLNDETDVQAGELSKVINYQAKYVACSSSNARIEVPEVDNPIDANSENRPRIIYKEMIWDDEIKGLMQNQINEDAKRGILLAAKEIQLPNA